MSEKQCQRPALSVTRHRMREGWVGAEGQIPRETSLHLRQILRETPVHLYPIHMYIYVYICLWIRYVYVYVCLCVCVYVYTYIYAYIMFMVPFLEGTIMFTFATVLYCQETSPYWPPPPLPELPTAPPPHHLSSSFRP